MEDSGWRVKNSYPFKLKDRAGKNMHPLHIMKTFGFVPDIIIIQQMKNTNSWFMVSAVMTADELKKEKQLKIKEKNEHKPTPTKGHTKKDDVS